MGQFRSGFFLFQFLFLLFRNYFGIFDEMFKDFIFVAADKSIAVQIDRLIILEYDHQHVFESPDLLDLIVLVCDIAAI